MSTTTQTLRCTVNGAPVSVHLTDDGLTLLDVLRDHLGITSPKNGCQPQAQCGCCTVLVDGKPMLSCTMKPSRVEGKAVTTLEGLDEQHRKQIADSFVQCGGVQCGFCIPGFAMRGVGLCNANPTPSRDEITKAVRPHLCRCTGYKQVIDSIELYSKVRAGEQALPQTSASDASGKVGTSLPRYTGHDAVLGDRKYVDDMTVPGMLFGALRLSDHPRATVVKIDATKALELEGVHRVITARDVPGEIYVGLIVKDWPVFVALGSDTRCTGDVIAAVVADDRAAWHAERLN
ncbi:MAG: 2Fe-2S iron-sulfur cluster-binding protein [Phycisphaerales bacterium]